MLDISFNAAAAQAHSVVIGNSRDLTLTQTGGIAQGKDGKRADLTSTIPMFNLANSDAASVVTSLASTEPGGTMYTRCDIDFTTITAGSAIATKTNKYNNVNGVTLPPTQIRLIRKTARRRRALKSFGRTLDYIASLHAPPGPFNTMINADKTNRDKRFLQGRKGRQLNEDKEELDTLEVGQTLFEPVTHPGFLEGKELVVGSFIQQCSAKSCAKCHLYDVPLSPAVDYTDKVIVFQMNTLVCIKPYSQYVYFASRAGAAGVLFISDSKKAHLETLGPAQNVDFQIPSFVVPNGGMALEDVGAKYVKVQFPTIVNGVASETIGEAVSPDMIEEDLMEHSPPLPEENPLSAGMIVLIVVCSSLCCRVVGYYTFKTLNRRHQRGKLHAIGRITHSTGTSAFVALDEMEEEGERYLTANGSNFVGIAMTTPSSSAGSGRGGVNGGSRSGRRESGTKSSFSSKDAFEETQVELTAQSYFEDEDLSVNKKKLGVE